MKTYKLITLIIIVLFSISCEDFFETTIDLDVPEHESKLAVTSLVNNGETNAVLVSYSIGGLAEVTGNQLITDAMVTLLYDDVAIAFSPSENEGIYTADFPVEFMANENYTLQVSASNYETVSSVQTFPNRVEISNVTMNENKLKVTFQDMPNTKNYYLLELLRFNEYDGSWEETWIDPFGSSSYWSATNNNAIIFNDDVFDGDEYEIIAERWGDPNDTSFYKVKLYNITEDYYRYDRSLDLASGAEDNPFTEPVILHRNIENGYGIFAMGNVDEFEFTVE